MKYRYGVLVVLGLVFVLSRSRADNPAETPPVAKKMPHETSLHGETLVDNYFWLREKSNKEVIAYLESENAYTESKTKHLKPFQERLYKEVLGRIKQTDLSVPVKDHGFYYYSRTVEGKQYPIRCRKKGSLDGSEEILLDANEMGKGQKFFSIGRDDVSDDGNLLAYTTDTTGFREYHLFIKDLRNGKDLPDRVGKVSSFTWAADGKTLFYVTEDSAKRPYRLYRHVLGSTAADQLLMEEKNELYRLFVSRSRDRKYVFAGSRSSTTSDVWYLPADRPEGEFRIVLPREEGHEYRVDHRDGLFYITTNRDAKNFRLVTAPVAEPGKWTELIPHRPKVNLAMVAVFSGHLVMLEREEGLPHLAVRDLESGETHRVRFPEPVYSVFPDANPEFDTTTIRFRYQSLVTPPSVYEYDLKSRERKLLKQDEVVGGYDATRYVSERVWATAKDGTRIPISLVHRKDIKRDGTAPLWLSGYGSYGASSSVSFSTMNLSLLDRGVIVAWAHIRGGGDMGEEWHDQGKMMNKKNTFTDFIACADHLVTEKYTSQGRLAIQGGSAGGLLIGAVLNLRPDLCKVAVLNVPFVDVINTMLDETLPLTVPEFLEWGNPKVKREYDYIKTYCPYTNLRATDYPTTLVTTSLNDSQVMYWEPAKYVAKMRSLRTDTNPLLLKTNMAGGHGGSSGRYDSMRERVFAMAFVMNQLGVHE